MDRAPSRSGSPNGLSLDPSDRGDGSRHGSTWLRVRRHALRDAKAIPACTATALLARSIASARRGHGESLVQIRTVGRVRCVNGRSSRRSARVAVVRRSNGLPMAKGRSSRPRCRVKRTARRRVTCGRSQSASAPYAAARIRSSTEPVACSLADAERGDASACPALLASSNCVIAEVEARAWQLHAEVEPCNPVDG